jgi:hypothetical protein
MVWVGMSRGRFVGGRNVKAPIEWVSMSYDKKMKRNGKTCFVLSVDLVCTIGQTKFL